LQSKVPKNQDYYLELRIACSEIAKAVLRVAAVDGAKYIPVEL